MGFPGTSVIDGWELNLGLLQVQLVLLASEPPLSALKFILMLNILLYIEYIYKGCVFKIY